MSEENREIDVVRAWKDPEYRASLSQEELASLPENPAGDLESNLSDEELDDVSGGTGTSTILKSIGKWGLGCIIPAFTAAGACPSINAPCPSGYTACNTSAIWCPAPSYLSGCPKPPTAS